MEAWYTSQLQAAQQRFDTRLAATRKQAKEAAATAERAAADALQAIKQEAAAQVAEVEDSLNRQVSFTCACAGGGGQAGIRVEVVWEGMAERSYLIHSQVFCSMKLAELPEHPVTVLLCLQPATR